MTEVEIVERPLNADRRFCDPISRALLASATSGKAVRIALNGEDSHKVQHRHRQRHWRTGYRFHYRCDGDTHLVMWLETQS